MKNKSKKSNVAPIDPYLEGLMGKLLDRLVSLEKKMDTIIAQGPSKNSAPAESSKPFQNSEIKQAPRRERVLYEAICADCHKVCEVPFKPSEDRAVYCKECFSRRKNGGKSSNFPVLTPVALPPKPLHNKPLANIQVPVDVKTAQKKAKKSPSAKKSKKRK